ncbi:TonB-dependent receptor [Halioxenophilus aromaticivorans]|uniref:TonB-dependent receptor n=1 Tax=Halioxenophilus aromaticivorans TaxID=1306992 RepID=A0AAV3U5J5_9ALTE
MNITLKRSPLWIALSAVGALSSHSALVNAQDQAAAIEEIVVEASYRASLAKAIDAERDAANARESIMAEDMGKMPDLNLAESLQRVPGVAISREGGEGRQITIRGLGPEFTRTTLNGMEVPASTDGLDSSGGLNGGRSFDFNVFASELFNRIDIHKTPTAAVEEGGLAGTVDLYTAKPFDNPGFNSALSIQGGYNSLTEETDPRISVMVSNTFADDTIGVLFSLASTERTVRQEGFGTVRWQQATGWADTSNTVVNGSFAPGYSLDNAWTPRLPRTDYFANEQDRLGATASFQLRPTDQLELSLDLAHSNFENNRESYNFDAQFRSNYDDMTPVEVFLNDAGTDIIAGQFNDVNLRTESRLTQSETDFYQTVFSAKYDINDNMRLSGLLGVASSEFRVEQYRFNIITAERQSYGYDFRANNNIAELSYGYDILDPSFYQFANPTLRANDVERENETAKIDLEILGDSSSFRTGIIYNSRMVDSSQSNISDRTTPATLTGLTQEVPVDDFGTRLSAPSGFPRSFLVNNFGATIAAYQIGGWETDETSGNTWRVEEETLGAYFEFDTESELFGRTLRTNAGLRIVETSSTMQGAVAFNDGVVPVTVENTYVDVLPSINFAWEVTEDLQMRLNFARNLSRPGLGSLTPTSSYSGVNGTLSGGNPELDPMRAESVDIAAEWYFAEESLLGATLFYKDIESFIASDTVERILDPVYANLVLNDVEYDPNTWQPVTEPWTHTQPINNDGAKVKGFELAYQQPFSFLPAPFNHLGFTGNYTWVQSESEYGTGSDLVTADLIGLSENSLNLTLYYETETYGARLSMNDRDDYNTRVPGRNGNSIEATSGYTQYDLSAFYNINDNITLTLEAINIFDEKERLYVGEENRVREYNHTGAQYFLGLRAAF